MGACTYTISDCGKIAFDDYSAYICTSREKPIFSSRNTLIYRSGYHLKEQILVHAELAAGVQACRDGELHGGHRWRRAKSPIIV
jgi:hypothetical protein